MITGTGHGYRTSYRHTQQIITDMPITIGCRQAMNTVTLVENSHLGILLFKVHNEKLSVFIFPYNTDDFGDHPELLLMCKWSKEWQNTNVHMYIFYKKYLKYKFWEKLMDG